MKEIGHVVADFLNTLWLYTRAQIDICNTSIYVCKYISTKLHLHTLDICVCVCSAIEQIENRCKTLTRLEICCNYNNNSNNKRNNSNNKSNNNNKKKTTTTLREIKGSALAATAVCCSIALNWCCCCCLHRTGSKMSSKVCSLTGWLGYGRPVVVAQWTVGWMGGQALGKLIRLLVDWMWQMGAKLAWLVHLAKYTPAYILKMSW